MSSLVDLAELAETLKKINEKYPNLRAVFSPDKSIANELEIKVNKYTLNDEGLPVLVAKDMEYYLMNHINYFSKLNREKAWSDFGPFEKEYYNNNFEDFKRFVEDTVSEYTRQLDGIKQAEDCLLIKVRI